MQVLIIEDGEDDFLLVKQIVDNIGDVQLEWRPSLAQGMIFIEFHLVEVLLLDMALPDGNGWGALEQLQIQFPMLPIIILSSDDRDERALEAVRRGVQDYLIKSRLDTELLGRALRYAIERKRLEERLRRSEGLYRTFAHNFPNGALVLFDQDLRYILVDGLGLADLGLSKDIMEGKTIWEVFPPQLAAAGELRMRAVLAGETVSQEITYANQSIQMNYVPIRDQKGTILCGMIMSQIITAQKQAEARFRALLESTPDAMVIVDQNGTIVLVNHQTEILFGYKPDELIGKPVEILIPEAHSKNHQHHRRRYTQEPHVRMMGTGIELYALRKDGSHFPVEVSLSPIQTQEGVLIASGIRDVTQRKQAEEAIRESERRLRLLAENSPDNIYILSLTDHHAIYFNRSDFLGYSQHEIEAEGSLVHAIHPDDKSLVMEHWQKITLDGKLNPTELIEYRVLSKSGEWRWIQSRETIFTFTSNGKPEQILITLTDITARKKAEDNLRQEHDLLRTLIDSSPDYIFIKDTEGRFVLSNIAHAQAAGLSPEAVVGKMAHEMFPDELADQFQADDEQILISGKPLLNLERRTLSGTQEPKTVLTSKIPLRDKEGRVISIIGISRDITERKLLEVKTIELMAEKERIKMLQQFINDMSHDFRTPLSIISSSLYMLQKSPDPMKRQIQVDKVEQQILRMDRLLSEILQMEHLDESSTKFQLASTEINAFLMPFIRDYERLTIPKHIALEFTAETSSCFARIDPVEFGRAITKLLDNAVFYTPEGGRIWIGTRIQHGRLVIFVRDTGIGIEVHDLPHIFERFYRADKARSTQTGGSGLGLSIVQKIIEAHEGSIEVDSIPGQGSTFTIYLPVELSL